MKTIGYILKDTDIDKGFGIFFLVMGLFISIDVLIECSSYIDRMHDIISVGGVSVLFGTRLIIAK